jgi:hypothetical protein
LADKSGSFVQRRWRSLVDTLAAASNPEKVRAVLALTLVGVLMALQFEPSANAKLTTVAETLAIAAVGFYFGIQRGQGTQPEDRDPIDGVTPPEPSGSTLPATEPGDSASASTVEATVPIQ